MEAILNLKGCSETSVSVCLLCLKPPPKGKKLSNGKDKSVRALQNSAALRKAKYDPERKGAINRIEKLSVSDRVSYHSSCYATFTSKDMIKRLPEINSNVRNVENNDVNTNQADISETKWDQCILCQKPQERNSEHLRKITSESVQQKIRDLAEWDVHLNVRIGGPSTNLIAAKVQYHTNCYNKREREKIKLINESAKPKSSNLALQEISAELHITADKGEVRAVVLVEYV